MRVGLIGYGYWGKILRPKLEKYFDVAFVANSETQYELEGLDWVFIVTPTNTHYDIVKKCLNASINVFCEKPLTLNPDKSKELFDLARSKGVKLYVDNIFLGRHDYQRFKGSLKQFRNHVIKDIKFEWYKYGPFNDTLVNDLLYHDVYISLDLVGLQHNIELIGFSITTNTLDLTVKLGDVKINYCYDRSRPTKNKVITMNENYIFPMNHPPNDPLSDIIRVISDNGDIDYDFNEKITIKTEQILKEVWEL